jgi:hypothetical protein
MSEAKYDRLPCAGDTENKFGTEFVYLSPMPIPTGLPALSARNLHREANETYLDFSVGRGNFEFMARVGIGAVMFFIVFLFFLTGYLSWLRRHVEPFLSSWWEFFFGPAVWTITIPLAVLYTVIFYFSTRQITQHPPIRFNRQRREIVFIPKKGVRPHYVAWESTIACVSAGQLITQYATIPEFKLMIGLREAESGNILWSSIPCGSLSLAISEWEAIRSYMEEGVSALPVPQTDELEEGSVSFFHLCRRAYRTEHSLIRYVWGFLIIQFFSGWTLPCYISGWVNNRPKASFPKEVLQWSKPMPSDQHVNPSQELLHKSAEIRSTFEKGKTFLDHFKPKRSNPEPNTENNS